MTAMLFFVKKFTGGNDAIASCSVAEVSDEVLAHFQTVALKRHGSKRN
jgi:hypothetical protein